MDLITALQTKDTVTENGMPTNSTSLNRCVDLFFMIGALRGQNPQRILNKFIKAFYENKVVALKILFWGRDVRGGAGERSTFRIIWRWVCQNHPEIAVKNLSYVDFLGRWDDHLCGIGTPVENSIIERIQTTIEDNNQLAAKWMPRKGKIANVLRKRFKMSAKKYRKFLVDHTNVVEQKICSKNWSSIDYGKLPSLALSRYGSFFRKNDGQRYADFLNAVSEGKVKINTGAIYPYDVIKNLRHGDSKTAIEQWNNLPNYMEENGELILPIVDVSGSMDNSIGSNPNVTAMDVALSLGLYISERNFGQFKDYFMTFSRIPKLQHLTGDLTSRLNQLIRSEWSMNTNIVGAFQEILTFAKNNSVPASDMPTKIIILSDMEFDRCTNRPDNSIMESIEDLYYGAGYVTPKIIFWNIQSRNRNVPVRYNKNDVALVSGFSPSILKILLTSDITNPYVVMSQVLNDVRYFDISA